MSAEVVMFIIGQLVTAGATAAGIYAAIRADMREYKVRIGMLEDWKKEHKCK